MHYRIALPITCLAIISGLINLSKMFFFKCKTEEFFCFAAPPYMFAARRKKAHPETAFQRVLFLSLSFSEAIKLAIKKSFSYNSMVGVRHLPFRVSDGVNKMHCSKWDSILNSGSFFSCSRKCSAAWADTSFLIHIPVWTNPIQFCLIVTVSLGFFTHVWQSRLSKLSSIFWSILLERNII